MHLISHEPEFQQMLRVGVALLLFISSLEATGTEFSRAEEMYNRAQYQAAVEVLKPYAEQPEALRLTGKSFFMLGDFKKATQYFQRLVRINPLSGVDFQWLGRAWARRADTSNPVNAPGYASKAQQSFEQAAKLDPHSVDTLKELLDLHLERRTLTKAQLIADRLAALNANEGVRAQERIEMQRRFLRTAEEQVRLAIDEVPRQFGRAADIVR